MEKEIEEGNKLIAEFMGCKFAPHKTMFDFTAPFNEYQKNHYNVDLKFHSSWDWLMPVVKKIDTICSENGSKLSNKSREQEHLKNPLDNPKHWKSWSYHYVKIYSIDIDIVYKDVIDFIKWYNGCKAVTPKRKN